MNALDSKGLCGACTAQGIIKLGDQEKHTHDIVNQVQQLTRGLMQVTKQLSGATAVHYPRVSLITQPEKLDRDLSQ